MNTLILPLVDAKVLSRFWQKIDRRDDGDCWPWKASKDKDGYGRQNVKGKLLKSHRMAWTIFNGAEPGGMLVLHTCDNPSCCNPNHLFLGTDADNTRDKVFKGRNKVGEHKGEANGHAKLTEENVREIRRLYSGGEFTYKELAEKFDVHLATVGYVVQGKLWPHV